MSAIDTRRRIMPINERERMKAEIHKDEADLKGDIGEVSRAMKKHLMKNPNERHININQQMLARKKRVIAMGEAPDLSSADIATLEKKEKGLVEWCRKRMVPKEDCGLMPSTGGLTNPDFRKAVNFMHKNEHSQEFMEKAGELKNIRRMLHRDDPLAGNLEYIRPTRSEAGSA